MKNWIVDIQVDEQFRAQVREEWLRCAVNSTLSSEGIDYCLEMSLLVTGDEKVHELNRKYRNIDKTTDVLSFAFSDDSAGDPFPQPQGSVAQMGEVIISCPQAARQADEENRSVEDELSILAVHGVLHLIGYDHIHPEDEQVMMTKQNRILDKLRCGR